MDDDEICREKIAAALRQIDSLTGKAYVANEEGAAVRANVRALYWEAKPALERLLKLGPTAELSLEQLEGWSNHLTGIQSYFADQRLSL